MITLNSVYNLTFGQSLVYETLPYIFFLQGFRLQYSFPLLDYSPCVSNFGYAISMCLPHADRTEEGELMGSPQLWLPILAESDIIWMSLGKSQSLDSIYFFSRQDNSTKDRQYRPHVGILTRLRDSSNF